MGTRQEERERMVEWRGRSMASERDGRMREEGGGRREREEGGGRRAPSK
jgi:hypothetical protein